jgi:hypothetical protein
VRVIDVDFHWRRLEAPLPGAPAGPGGWELAAAVTVPGRWVRLGAFWGQAPGSMMAGKHWAWWRTRMGGGFTGVNLRVGWWPAPCLTLLAHTRPENAWDLGRPRLVWAQARAGQAGGLP